MTGQVFWNDGEKKYNDNHIYQHTGNAGKSITFGPVLLPQPRKSQCADGIKENDHCHPGNVLRVLFKIGPNNNIVFEQKQQTCEENG